jgi:hypothetical protein
MPVAAKSDSRLVEMCPSAGSRGWIAVAQVRLAALPALRQGGRVQVEDCAPVKLRGGESVPDVAAAYSCVDCTIDLGRSGSAPATAYTAGARPRSVP